MQLKRLHFPTIDSTNSWVKEHVNELDPESLTLVTADEQTGGRGRLGRTWHSPHGVNIYATYCFFRSALWAEVSHAPQVLALSTTDALEGLGIFPRLKWPNDIIIQGRKVGGVLCETASSQNGFAIIIGIGLNVNMPPEALDQINQPATSLMIEQGQELRVSSVIDAISQRFLLHLDRFLEEGFEPFFPWFRAMVSPVDPEIPIRFDDGRQIWDGHFEGVADDGGALVTTTDGVLRHFHSGEVLPAGV